MMNRILIICLLFVSCKEEKFSIFNLNNNQISIIGHGGSGFISPTNNIPDNSMKSLELAVEAYNADGIEVDIQMSKDSQLVMYHDKHLRTKTSCLGGAVHDYNWNELKECTYKKNYFGSVFVDEGLALLNEPVEKFSKRKVVPQIHLDIKSDGYDESKMSKLEYFDIISRKIVELIEQYQAEDWIYCGCDDIELLKIVNKLNPKIKLFIEGMNTTELLKKKIELDYFGIVINNDQVTKKDVERAHNQGVRVAIFNLKALPANKDGLRKSPDYLITDNITLVLDIIN